MRELSRSDAPALRALACLCLSDPSNPTNPGYGVTAEDVGKFWLGEDHWLGLPREQATEALRRLERDGYTRLLATPYGAGVRYVAWTPTARGWQAALMPAETVDSKC